MTGIELLPPDYAVLITAGILGVAGLFGGVSGALAFLAGTAVSLIVARFGWALSEGYFTSMPLRILVVSVVTLLTFGVTRAILRACVHKLLAQPADALFGFLISAFTGAGLALIVLFGLKYANLLQSKSVFLDFATRTLNGLW